MRERKKLDRAITQSGQVMGLLMTVSEASIGIVLSKSPSAVIRLTERFRYYFTFLSEKMG
ncbi:MAG: hypothetical protein E3J26_00005 [Candidatus Zixiibacteriota bacterium]|nr:MAG: hypothetical protein E3J26_00005 [candidate division Zixibacteria bacterium]